MCSIDQLFSTCNPAEVSDLLSHITFPLENADDLNPLMGHIGNAKYVLLGAASHGTHEYYSWRMKITKRLIEEKNFSFIAVEGDWPDCYRLNRFIKGYPYAGKSAQAILEEFKRWPTWIWANWEMVDFADWLKNYNANLLKDERIGFYGLDVFSFGESMNAIVNYLEKNDTEALKKAKKILNYFEPFLKDEGESFARSSIFISDVIEKELLSLLKEINRKISHYNSDKENVLSTQQNAYVAVNAERYYRTMLNGGTDAWNIRDRHMSKTLDRLMKYHGEHSKVIVWEHNAHVGDARATDMCTEGMINLGQLITEKYASDGVVAVGFGSFSGSVIAGRKWGDVMRKIIVPEAIPGSWEDIFHIASGGNNRLLMMNRLNGEACISSHILHRGIGVVYNPESEKFINYVPSIIPMRYDAFIYIDKTKALHPLHFISDGDQTPDTYPFGF
jgi:erythromycin esterase